MDIAGLALSTLIYAPGLVLLALFALFGTVALMEKKGLVGNKATTPATAGANPAPGRAVAALDESLDRVGQEKASNQ